MRRSACLDIMTPLINDHVPDFWQCLQGVCGEGYLWRVRPERCKSANCQWHLDQDFLCPATNLAYLHAFWVPM